MVFFASSTKAYLSISTYLWLSSSISWLNENSLLTYWELCQTARVAAKQGESCCSLYWSVLLCVPCLWFAARRIELLNCCVVLVVRRTGLLERCVVLMSCFCSLCLSNNVSSELAHL